LENIVKNLNNYNKVRDVNFITDILGGRKDHKIDCLAADFKEWEVSWDE
jgi:hypothetical protein